MPKQKRQKPSKSSDTAQPADTSLLQPTPDNQSAPIAMTEEPSAPTPSSNELPNLDEGKMVNASLSADEKIAKLQQDQERMAQMLMQIVGYIDQNKQGALSPAAAGGGLASPTPGIPGLGSLPIGDIIKAGLQLFNAPAAPPVSPVAAMFEKGMMESFNKTFESFVESINTKNRIADAVIAAIEKGTLKLTTETAATA